MSQLTIVRKSKWRWITHVATFIAALLGTCTVTVSAHSTDLYQYGTYPTPHYQAPPNYYQAPPQYYYAGGVRTARHAAAANVAVGNVAAGNVVAGNAPSPSSRHVW